MNAAAYVDLREGRGATVRRIQGGWQVTCPAHEDRTPSLAVTAGDDDRVLLHCHAGCEVDAVVAADGLTPADLFADSGRRRNGRVEVAAYDYVDEAGELLFQCVRFRPKGFSQRRPDGRGGWIWNLQGVRRVLYRLHAVIEAVKAGQRIYIVEGEKDVHAIERAGAVATCNPMGAGNGKWKAEFSEFLRGAIVIIVADRDKDGRAHARRVVASLRGIAASVLVVEAAVGKDAHDHLAAGKTLEDFVPVTEQPGDDTTADPSPQPGTPGAALADSLVDLIDLIRHGIPEPTFVPGCTPWLISGKRYLCPAPAGAGKSLVWLTVAVTVVEAGGKVVILDVENGEDEYARRLEDILAARDDVSLPDLCQQRLRYHAWPTLALTWNADEWAAELQDVDLVVFDSSRMALTSVGLAEDSADDYSQFMGRLIWPLSRAGITTVVLDNTGHDGDRARGTKAKEDLNEVVYRLTVPRPFDRDTSGEARLVRGRHRFAGLPREIAIPLGGGAYGPPTVALDEGKAGRFRPTNLMETTSKMIEHQPGITATDLRSYVKGKTEYAALALRLLIEEGYVRTEPDGKTVRHHSVRRYRERPEEDREGGLG